MQRSHVVRPAAMFWGLTAFLPVGVNYLAALLMLLALLFAGGWRVRAERLRSNPMWWPVTLFVVWTLVVLSLEPQYPETGSNLVHGLRIAATVLMALSLTRQEALWGMRGFWLIGLANLVIIALYYTVGFPQPEALRGVLREVGNKSISNALLFTIMAASAAVYALRAVSARRPLRALPAVALIGAVVAVAAFSLHSRTSLLALLIAMAGACAHQWRGRLKVLVPVLLIGGAVAAAGLWTLPPVQQKFELGVKEIEEAQAGAVSEGSWVVRFYMYRDTARMIIDRPFAGWGIGGWTEQWHLRGPKLLADYNMPHNDFLWMGSQAGVPGSLSLMLIVLTAVVLSWRRRDLAGRHAFAATLVMLVATSLNSALRDAQIGLALLWVAMNYLRLAQLPGGEPWQELLPRRPAAAQAPGFNDGGAQPRLP
ncbi:MAG TPA: O-antigen ligase family protein [Variovorax sp.]